MNRDAPVLHDWQAEAVEQVRHHFRRGVRRVLLVAPTGSGKTVMASHLVSETRERRNRAVFVCDRIPLIDQTSATFDRYDIPHGVIQAEHWRTRRWERVQVASAQTLGRRTWPELGERDLIIVDEAHTIHDKVMERTARRDCFVVGLTATPFTRGLGLHYDAVVTVRTLDQLTADGYLAPFRVYGAVEPDMAGVAVNGKGEWDEKQTAERAMPIVGDVVTEYLRHGKRGHFIAFGVNVAHCQELQRQFEAAGILCGLYTHKTVDAERAQMIRDFAPGGHLRGLISVAALSKGFDAPHVGVVIMARPLRKSLAEHIQILGRGLRTDPANPDKKCLVLDHAGNTVRLGGPMYAFFAEGVRELDDGRRKEKKKAEKKEPEPYKCPTCSTVHRAMPMCPKCGHEYPRRASVEHVAGELAEIGAGLATHDERQSVYSGLLGLARRRGYSDGWAAHKYRERFGVWPNRLNKVPGEPSRELEKWVRSREIAWRKGKGKAA